jgi:hypothetical protein
MLQVALINPLIHVKGYSSAETRAAVERAHFLRTCRKSAVTSAFDPSQTLAFRSSYCANGA